MSTESNKSGSARGRRLAGGKRNETRAVFMISVAAERAGMHPQTLRMYEARGLITPKRSAKQTRLYSQADVKRLRRIQQMTAEAGLNLAGVETVLEMEAQLERMRTEMARVQERADAMRREMLAELERVRSSMRAEIVPYRAYETELAPGRRKGNDPVQIPIKRGAGQRSRKRG